VLRGVSAASIVDVWMCVVCVVGVVVGDGGMGGVDGDVGVVVDVGGGVVVVVVVDGVVDICVWGMTLRRVAVAGDGVGVDVGDVIVDGVGAGVCGVVVGGVDDDVDVCWWCRC